MQQNLQQPEVSVHSQSGTLEIVNVWKTIQGEGPFAGTPAVFVRLAGCNIQCKWCDTDYTTGRHFITFGDLVQQVGEVSNGLVRPLVVITGGEPLRQNLEPFIETLLRRDYTRQIQIETNGMLFPKWLPNVVSRYKKQLVHAEPVAIVCSPKGPVINNDLQIYIRAYKYVVEAGCVSATDGLPSTTLGGSWTVGRPHADLPRKDIYVQPMDEQDPEKNAAHLKAAVESCLTFGHKLCLQTHKIIGLE